MYSKGINNNNNHNHNNNKSFGKRTPPPTKGWREMFYERSDER